MIKNYFDELSNIKAEIVRNNQRNKLLKKRATELEGHILEYLKEKEQQGVKYQGKAIVVKTQEKFKQNKKLKQELGVGFFRDLGVRDPEAAYRQLQEVQKGEPVEKQTLKFKNLKK
jgi:hypothetical protein